MPIVLQPVVPPTLTRDDVRGFLRDYVAQIPGTGQENILLDGVEFSDVDIERGIRFTTSRYNAMTPVTRKTPDAINDFVLLCGTASWLLASESTRQIRNQASTQDADVTNLGIDDKWQLYRQLSQDMSEMFEKYARGIKTQANMEAAYGGFGSGYRTVSRRFS